MKKVKLMCIALLLLASIPTSPAWARGGHHGGGGGHHGGGHHGGGHHGHHHGGGHHHNYGGYGLGWGLGLGAIAYWFFKPAGQTAATTQTTGQPSPGAGEPMSADHMRTM
ncbi:MAG: hypothetical protein ABJA60_08965, partial [Nitrosospira sp.]